jgi:hypothetical protein
VNSMAIQPIFIFSISRSGSTLVQRIIAAHASVATVSEPWLLVPHGYTFRHSGIDAEYPHALMVDAIEDFCKELPGGVDEYRRELHDYIVRLYEKAAGHDARYFLDKSPYSLMVDEVMRLFPEGKFIFLWRNPLSIVASIMSTWEHAKWQPTLFSGELFVGLPRLVAAYRNQGARAYAVRFEDLIGGDERRWAQLMSYLGIEFERDALKRFSQVKLHGRSGDPTGVKRYAALSTEPIQKWRGAFANPLRREWGRRYLRFLGSERLALMGYDSEQILRELNSVPVSTDSLLPDLGRLIKDVAKEPIRVRTRNRKIGSPNVIRTLLNA